MATFCVDHYNKLWSGHTGILLWPLGIQISTQQPISCNRAAFHHYLDLSDSVILTPGQMIRGLSQPQCHDTLFDYTQVTVLLFSLRGEDQCVS